VRGRAWRELQVRVGLTARNSNHRDEIIKARQMIGSKLELHGEPERPSG
jgi:hypothetical protein